MARFIKKIRARYEPLTMDDNRQVTEQEMLRAHEIIDKSLSDSAEDLYILKVHDEACDIINNNGVLFDDSYGELSEERAQRYRASRGGIASSDRRSVGCTAGDRSW
jgi:hypothetical protein